jgi:signal transduction histidine kinase
MLFEVELDGRTPRPVDYRFLELNPAFIQQTGLENATGRTIREMAPAHESHWFERYGRVALTGEPVRFEAPAEALGRYYDVYAFRVGAPEQRRVAVLFDDVSASKAVEHERERLFAELQAALAQLAERTVAAEAALQIAEGAQQAAEAASRAKSDFLAIMSHELRTPLNAIGGYAELLELGIHGPVSPDQRQALERIQQSQRHLLGLINQVLNYARIDAGVVRYDIADVGVSEALIAAESLVLPQLRARGLRQAHDVVDASVVVRADREKLQQVLLNLLTNAIKFTEPGGEVRVSCTPRERVVDISVADTGIGIAPEKRPTIFEPFVQVDQRHTRAHEGVGLGLAISRDLARGMGGDLTVASTPGEGSVFTLTLPRARHS